MSIKGNWRRHGSEVVIRWYQRFFSRRFATCHRGFATQFCRPQREKNLWHQGSDLVESVEKEALRNFPDLNYSQALVRAGLQTLSERRNQICVRFFQNLSVSPFPCLASLLPERTSVNHGFGLRSGSVSQVTNINRLQRTDRFITFKYTWHCAVIYLP